MNLNRLFELAGLSNNLLLEAAYDGMIDSLKKNFPNNIKEIDDNIKMAKIILKKQDRIVWYIKILRAYLSNNINAVKGDYNFTDMQSFNNDFFHYYGYNFNEIENTQLTNQNISELFQTFNSIIQTYQKSDKAPVPVQHGDYELIKCNDGTSWWFIDRSYCEEEGRSGKHCGNVTGKHNTNQRILSLRTPNHNVILTFILESNGYLGEMKAKANLKPAEQYHPNIMQLLLNPIVKGIKGAGYAPWMNFSIFDLSDNDIKIIIQHGKQYLIADQIKAEPIEFLKAPDYIKNVKEYQEIAIKKLPALKHLIGEEHNIQSWENAISEKKSLIIYAPNDITDFVDRITKYLISKPDQLLKCPKSVLNNFEITHAVVSNDTDSFRYLVPSVNKYFELATIAVEHWGGNLTYIPESNKHFVELCKIAVKNSSTSIKYVPSSLKEYKDICLLSVQSNAGSLEFIPEELKTFELCKTAIQTSPFALEYLPFDTMSHKDIYELCKIGMIRWKGSIDYISKYIAPKNILTDEQLYEFSKMAIADSKVYLKYVPDKLKEKLKQEFNIQESLDLKYFQNL